MIRFIYVIILRIFSIMYFVPKMAYYAKHPEKYSEEDCYALARTVVGKVKKTARVTTEYYGLENLPEGDEGYIMFSNHQGKYDAVGILNGHKRPCTVLMDEKRSKVFISKQFVDLLRGQRISRTNPIMQVKTLKDMAREVAEDKRVYLVFPEGGYRKDQDNVTNEFKRGCFLCAQRAKCPIVPVAIIDSYKPFGVNSLKRVTTKVVFLPSIPYAEYSDMKTAEISDMVKSQIDETIKKYTA
ncbi:MAG: 1-acyl-sn-glycerol-3-phosphate acyltransferase [Clostridia bacterium]|nr:1-acyl-sn-glycerol-3-phosphate acyltransferase [Clostridia bacterium]